MSPSIPVIVLGCAGSVGQRFIQLLDAHPWFTIVALTGSDRSIGHRYEETCHWILPEPMPESVRKMVVLPTTPDREAMGLQGVKNPVAFSALPTDIARTTEPQFAQAGFVVCSNASAYRREEDVPILLPEINADHCGLVPIQRQKRGWSGAITTNPNCTSTGLTVALKALDEAFGLRKAFVVSLQAISGAGYPGVASLDILDNVIPNIGGEEEKVEWEPRKMLGKLQGEKIIPADFIISAHTNRVAVSDGHIICASVELENKADLPTVLHAIEHYTAPESSRSLPSAPKPVLVYRQEADRPQPRLDRMTGQGMATVVGRLRPDPLFDYKFAVLSHNTIRGAAGGSIYNAELLVKLGMVE